MRRFALPALYVAVGFALCWVVARPTGPPAAPLPPVDFGGEVTVRRALGPTQRYKTHSVHVDNRPAFLAADPPDPDAPVTVLTLDGGRVKIAATDAP